MSIMNINMGVFEEVPILVESKGVELIVGREKECELVKTVANFGGTNMIIKGAYGIGKTTMLMWAEKRAFTDFFTVRIDGEKVKGSGSFFFLVSKEIISKLRDFFRFQKVSPLSKPVVLSVEAILKKAFNKGDFWTYKEAYRELLNVLTTEGFIGKGKPLMVFIDDFGLTGVKYADARSWLKSFMSYEKDIRIVMTMQTHIFSKLSVDDPALLSRFNPKISLRFLTKEEIKEILRRRLMVAKGDEKIKDVWYPFTEGAVEKIADESNGVPRKALYITKEILLSALPNKVPIDDSYATKFMRMRGLDTYSFVLDDLGKYAKLIHDTIQKNGGCMRLMDISRYTGMQESKVRYWLNKMEYEGGFVHRRERGVYCLSDVSVKEGEGF